MSQTKILDKLSMSGSDVMVKEEDEGYANQCLDVSEFGVSAINRELVNLENAAVNIDNSSDVIIGPVTQFNVNGNVTIFQNNDGLPLGIEADSSIANKNSCTDEIKAQPSADKCQNHKDDREVFLRIKRPFTLKIYLGLIFLLFLLSGVITTTIIFTIHKNTEEPLENSTFIDDNFGSHLLISKKDWSGRNAKKITPMNSPVDFVVIKHTGGTTCNDYQSCAKKVQDLQSGSFDNLLDDIYCSFVIGGDGNVYEGRGWNAKPQYVDNGIDIVYPGNFVDDKFTSTMINATKAFLEYGVNIKKLTKNYRLVNHNQTANTMSPGKNVIQEVRKWPHYDGRLYKGNPIWISNFSTIT